MNLALSTDEIRTKAPAIFSEVPMEGVSDRYSFISTKSIIDLIEEQGWNVAGVQQQKPRSKYAQRAPFKRHLVRFRNPDLAVDGNHIPELVLVNSHDRTSTFKFYAGIFRLVCSNGLIIAEQVEGMSLKHMGIDGSAIEYVLETVSKRVHGIYSQIEVMKKVSLTRGQRLDIAEEVVKMKWRDKAVVNPADLLQARRTEDDAGDLWTVYNVIQENLMKGGLAVQTTSGRVKHTRQIKNIIEDVRVNTSLWQIVEARIN